MQVIAMKSKYFVWLLSLSTIISLYVSSKSNAKMMWHSCVINVKATVQIKWICNFF